MAKVLELDVTRGGPILEGGKVPIGEGGRTPTIMEGRGKLREKYPHPHPCGRGGGGENLQNVRT